MSENLTLEVVLPNGKVEYYSASSSIFVKFKKDISTYGIGNSIWKKFLKHSNRLSQKDFDFTDLTLIWDDVDTSIMSWPDN